MLAMSLLCIKTFVLFTDKNFTSSGPVKVASDSFFPGIWNTFTGKVENCISKVLSVYLSILFKVTWALHINLLKLKSQGGPPLLHALQVYLPSAAVQTIKAGDFSVFCREVE